MHKIQSASALLCESVRTEASGSVTAIGIYTGNIVLPKPETMLSLASLITFKPETGGNGEIAIKFEVTNEFDKLETILMVGELEVTEISQMVIAGPALNIAPKHDCVVTIRLMTLDGPAPDKPGGFTDEDIESRVKQDFEILTLSITVMPEV